MSKTVLLGWIWYMNYELNFVTSEIFRFSRKDFFVRGHQTCTVQPCLFLVSAFFPVFKMYLVFKTILLPKIVQDNDKECTLSLQACISQSVFTKSFQICSKLRNMSKGYKHVEAAPVFDKIVFSKVLKKIWFHLFLLFFSLL